MNAVANIPEENRAELFEQLRQLPQREMPVTHRFQPHIYIREIFMPADTWVVGHIHRHRHWNIILTGKALVEMEGKRLEVKAGDVIESGPGVQKILYIVEDMRWITIHENADDSKDVAELEERIVVLTPDESAAKGRMTLDEFRMSLANQDLSLCPSQS